jgi:hypothetical protein
MGVPIDANPASSSFSQARSPSAGDAAASDSGERSAPSGETKEAVVESSTDEEGASPSTSSSSQTGSSNEADQSSDSSIKAASALLPDSEGPAALDVSTMGNFLDISAMPLLPQAAVGPLDATATATVDLAGVLEDAFGGGATSGSDIGSLLDHLSTGEAANQLFLVEADSGGDQAVIYSYNAFQDFDFAMISQEAAGASA